MKKFKRFTAALLTLTMGTALFTGCRGGETQTDETDGEGNYTFQVGHVVTADQS